MAIDFPNSPALDDVYTVGSRTWTWTGTNWELKSSAFGAGTVGTTELADSSVTTAKLASGVAVSNIGYTPANVAGPTFTGTVTLPSTTSIGTVSATEIGYVDGVTSAIQTQLDSKLTATTAVTSGRNAVINGNMDVWQRGTSFTISAGVLQYTADRWQQYFNAGGTITQETTVKTDTSLFSLKMTATATSPDNAIYQLVEQRNMARFRGKTVTVSVKLAGTATTSPFISLAYSTTADDGLINTGTGATVVSTTSPVINASTFVTYIRTFTLPTTAKTLRIGVHTGSVVNTNVLYVDEVQLEEGAIATPFEFEDAQVTLAKCQRYYYRIKATGNNYPLSMAGQCYSATGAVVFVHFPVTMRTPPTALEQSGTAADYKVWNAGTSGVNCNSVQTFNNSNNQQSSIEMTVASGLVAGNATTLLSTGSNAYLGWSAEL